jgi:ABC-2 type transport system permease protein
LILLALWLIFGVPIQGSLALLSLSVLLFVVANLMVGITFSTLAKNQMQAMQMTFFFFLPSLLLSGFMFPFRGMLGWAQALGEILPLTHFLRLVRGILLKGNGLAEVLPHLWPIALFLLAAAVVGLKRYRKTLD